MMHNERGGSCLRTSPLVMSSTVGLYFLPLIKLSKQEDLDNFIKAWMV